MTPENRNYVLKDNLDSDNYKNQVKYKLYQYFKPNEKIEYKNDELKLVQYKLAIYEVMGCD